MKTGIDRIREDASLLRGLGRIGVVSHQNVTTADRIPAVEAVAAACRATSGTSLSCVFGPQHGYWQSEQMNMLESPDAEYAFTDGSRVPLFSLYSETRVPTAAQMRLCDALVVDLPDIGTRTYTYMLTLAACLRAANGSGKPVVVLDRPNPLGLCHKRGKDWTRVEGQILDLSFHSFVGWYAIPMRHGLTLAELGRYFLLADGLDVDLRVVEVEGLTRATPPSALRTLPWIQASPNIPSWESAFLFPAMVAHEGTNLSEGRGTTTPFQVVGAPWFNAELAVKRFGGGAIPGMVARQVRFKPTFEKHVGQICHGVQWWPLDPDAVELFAFGVRFLAFCASEHAQEFALRDPRLGYEYNFSDPPLLLILGQRVWHEIVSAGMRGTDPRQLETWLQDALADARVSASAFAERCGPCLLYK